MKNLGYLPLRFYLLVLTNGVCCLKDVTLRVPEAVRVGESLSLSCDFILEPQEHLYSVKFYQGDTEFYRYVPGETPPTRVFALEGVKVDISRSNKSSVTLSDVHRFMTGYYKCEVSADAPLFHTAIKTSYVTIVEEPWMLPVLTAEKSKYSLEEKLRANCTSQGGFPLANLTWYLNGQQVKPSRHTRVEYETTRLDDLDTSVLRLDLDMNAQVFQESRLRLRCVATQYTLYRRSAELDLHEDTPQIAPVMGPTPPYSAETSGGLRNETCLQKLLFLLFSTTIYLQVYISSVNNSILR